MSVLTLYRNRFAVVWLNQGRICADGSLFSSFCPRFLHFAVATHDELAKRNSNISVLFAEELSKKSSLVNAYERRKYGMFGCIRNSLV